MNKLSIFRTNLKQKEGYHQYINLDDFKKYCWDYYLLFGIWLLENNYFEEVVVWRLSDKKIDDIIFNINGRKFIQKWVSNFREVFKYSKSTISFFRGGFKEYDEITKVNPNFFGLKLYLSAGKRLVPQYGGIYDKILIEDENDKIQNSIPFYKTTNPNIFKPLNLEKNYDICLISNFTQLSYKGTDFVIKEFSKNNNIKNLKICHVGNNNQVGIELCKKYNVTNIDFIGYLNRYDLNVMLNQSKFGLVSSNELDGCPRVITEILTSGTPLFIRNKTRLLNYYKKYGVVEFNDSNINMKIIEGLNNYNMLKDELLNNINNLSTNVISKMNIKLWKNN